MVILITILILIIYNNSKPCESLTSNCLKIGIFVISNGKNKKLDFPPDQQTNLSVSYYDRFLEEKKMWEKYKNNFESLDADVYFLECADDVDKKPVKMLNFLNTENLNCIESYVPGIYNKTLEAYKYFDDYDFYIRTNLSTFIIYNNLLETLKQLPRDRPVYAGQEFGTEFIQGTNIIMNKKARDVFVTCNPLFDDNINENPDDVLISIVFKKTNILPTKMQILYYWNWGLSIDKNIEIINKNKYSFIRTKPWSTKQNQKEVLNKLYKTYYH